MASKSTTSIPRLLILPRCGSSWRPAAPTRALARPVSGRLLVRYASKVATTKSTTAKTATTSKTTAAKVTAPKAVSTKASSSKSAAAKAAKASAPTKPPAKTASGSPASKVTVTSATAKPTTSRAAAKATAAATSKATTKLSPATPATAPPPVSQPEPVTVPAAPKTAAPITKPMPAPHESVPPKPIVLEKPERFNPPSHGARLPRSIPKHYGGAATTEEVQAQASKSYPGLPPPKNTWAHWFINNRKIHLFITLGTLGSLAVYTFAASFNEKSPFAELIPPISELPRHPFQYIATCFEVMHMHEEHVSAITAEKRRRKIDEVAKRNEYRKAHGLEPATGFWGVRALEKPAVDAASDTDVLEVEPGSTSPELESNPASAEFTPEGKRKKLFGVF